MVVGNRPIAQVARELEINESSLGNWVKTYRQHRRSFATRAQARFHVMQYIEVFYNRRRRHSTLGYRTPADVNAEHARQTAAAA